MKLEDIHVGDVVVLKSGGPHMVVKKIKAQEAGDSLVYCEWFVGQDVVAGYDFVAETIDPAKRYC